MIPGLQDTPPSVAFLAGFFLAAALRRARVMAIIHNLIGGSSGASDSDSDDGKAAGEEVSRELRSRNITAPDPNQHLPDPPTSPENPAADPDPTKTEDKDPGSLLGPDSGGDT